jgi:hypothetical protein
MEANVEDFNALAMRFRAMKESMHASGYLFPEGFPAEKNSPTFKAQMKRLKEEQKYYLPTLPLQSKEGLRKQMRVCFYQS